LEFGTEISFGFGICRLKLNEPKLILVLLPPLYGQGMHWVILNSASTFHWWS